MNSFLAVLAAAGGLALMTADANACSARGTFCGHPDWAANAFEGPRGSHAKGQINVKDYHYRPAYGYAYQPSYAYGYKHVKKHHHGHKKY